MCPATSETEAPTWPGRRPFVGRDDTLETLLVEVDAAVTEGGRAVFLLGSEGSGKTALVGVFQELVLVGREDREFLSEQGLGCRLRWQSSVVSAEDDEHRAEFCLIHLRDFDHHLKPA